jgi:hypothetical protein
MHQRRHAAAAAAQQQTRLARGQERRHRRVRVAEAAALEFYECDVREEERPENVYQKRVVGGAPAVDQPLPRGVASALVVAVQAAF